MKITDGKAAARWSCVVVLATSCAWGQDWPQWRGTNRDAKAGGFAAPSTWPKELTPKWQVTVGLGDATPALVSRRLYVFARQGDGYSARELWCNEDIGTGHNTPVLKYGRLGTVLDAGPILLALSVSDLLVIEPSDQKYAGLARYEVAQEQVYACPILAGNRIYIKDKETLTLWTLE